MCNTSFLSDFTGTSIYGIILGIQWYLQDKKGNSKVKMYKKKKKLKIKGLQSQNEETNT